MTSILKHSAYLVLLVLVSAFGAIEASDRFSPASPALALWLMAVTVTVMMAFLEMHRRYVLPRYFSTKRYGRYALWLIILALGLPVAVNIVQSTMAALYIGSFESINVLGWHIWLDTEGYSLAFPVLLALPLVSELLIAWRDGREQLARENENLMRREHMRLQQIVDPKTTIQRLHDIASQAQSDPRAADSQLRQLSQQLRRRLYSVEGHSMAAVSEDLLRARQPSLIENIFAHKRFAPVRSLMFMALIAYFCMMGYLSAPINVSELEGLLVIACTVLLLVVYILLNVRMFSRLINRRGRMWVPIAVLAVVNLGYIYIAINGISMSGKLARGSHLWLGWLEVASNISMMLLFMSLIALVVVLRSIMSDRLRMAEIAEAEARSELQRLQAQINPHFLFNVLNNTGVLIVDNPKEGAEMIRRLCRLLDYLFDSGVHERVSVGSEVAFLSDYLELERSRRDGFRFSISNSCADTLAPPMLMLPFVENAVKHTRSCHDTSIEININRKGKTLYFDCTNNFQESTDDGAPGGIGLYNLRQRLTLLFGKSFKLLTNSANGLFTARLAIPVQ